jgi:hypothetical protein
LGDMSEKIVLKPMQRLTLKIIRILILFLCVKSANAQWRTHINLYASLTPGIGIARYNAHTGFGYGISASKKPIETSRLVGTMYRRRYSPAYLELKFDLFMGSRKNTEVPNRYRLNPFVYAYYGKGTGEFFEWIDISSQKNMYLVDFTKVSCGVGLNKFKRLKPKSTGSTTSYLFWGFSFGVKTVISNTNINPNFGDGALNHIALRVNLGLLFSLRNGSPNN